MWETFSKADVIFLGPSSRPCLSKSVKHYLCIYILFIYLFISLNLFYLLTGGVESYFCTRSHSVTHSHTHTHTYILSRTPPDEESVRHTDLYNTHKRQITMLSAEFEPAIPASLRPQTYAVDCAATGIKERIMLYNVFLIRYVKLSLCCRIIPIFSNTDR